MIKRSGCSPSTQEDDSQRDMRESREYNSSESALMQLVSLPKHRIIDDAAHLFHTAFAENVFIIDRAVILPLYITPLMDNPDGHIKAIQKAVSDIEDPRAKISLFYLLEAIALILSAREIEHLRPIDVEVSATEAKFHAKETGGQSVYLDSVIPYRPSGNFFCAGGTQAITTREWTNEEVIQAGSWNARGARHHQVECSHMNLSSTPVISFETRFLLGGGAFPELCKLLAHPDYGRFVKDFAPARLQAGIKKFEREGQTPAQFYRTRPCPVPMIWESSPPTSAEPPALHEGGEISRPGMNAHPHLTQSLSVAFEKSKHTEGSLPTLNDLARPPLPTPPLFGRFARPKVADVAEILDASAEEDELLLVDADESEDEHEALAADSNRRGNGHYGSTGKPARPKFPTAHVNPSSQVSPPSAPRRRTLLFKWLPLANALLASCALRRLRNAYALVPRLQVHCLGVAHIRRSQSPSERHASPRHPVAPSLRWAAPQQLVASSSRLPAPALQPPSVIPAPMPAPPSAPSSRGKAGKRRREPLRASSSPWTVSTTRQPRPTPLPSRSFLGRSDASPESGRLAAAEDSEIFDDRLGDEENVSLGQRLPVPGPPLVDRMRHLNLEDRLRDAEDSKMFDDHQSDEENDEYVAEEPIEGGRRGRTHRLHNH
ncbi:hypothetical protein DFH07DRAFT_785355 [Mycena maculata]|uniref:Uncharacterized protein n=1 Tax=Mycena maculata TaxID=230809 RepID=A0AAD7HBG2_9AGAR|nr:hypothetical protein DFH07DRAFT_785355 [Mycena maculata]